MGTIPIYEAFAQGRKPSKLKGNLWNGRTNLEMFCKSSKGLVSTMSKKLIHVNITPLQKSPVYKWAVDITRHFSKDNIQMVNRHMKRCSPKYNEIPRHTCQNGYTPRHKKQVFARMWRQRKPLAPLVEMQMGAAPVENSMEVPQKLKNRTTKWSGNSTAEYLPKENENTNLKRYMHPCVYCSIIYNSENMGAMQVSIHRYIIYIYNNNSYRYNL